jgi:hypothetical protein
MRKVWVRVVSHLIALLLSACAFAQGARLGGSDSSAPGPWKQLAKLTEAKGHNQDWLGWSVAISKDGKTVVVGAVNWCGTPDNGCGQGAIFVFVKPTNGWADTTETALLKASDGQPGEYLGESVAISDDGSAIVAGAPLWPADGNGNGAAYVFVRPQGGWRNATETAKLTSTDGAGVNLGDSVAIDGSTVAAGGEVFNGLEGAAYVFVKPKSGWESMRQKARLTPSDGKGGLLGWSISMEADVIVAGAPITGTSGAGDGAYVFVKPKGGWKNRTETAKLTASSGNGFYLGNSVSIGSDTIAVGAPRRNNANGAVYVYVKPTKGWRSATERARLTVPPKFNQLGYSVAAYNNGKSIAAGDPGWQDGGGQGSAILFTEPMKGWKTTSKFLTRFVSQDGRNGDGLGFSTAATSGAIVAGAPDAMVGSNDQQGAVYVFGH